MLIVYGFFIMVVTALCTYTSNQCKHPHLAEISIGLFLFGAGLFLGGVVSAVWHVIAVGRLWN